MKTKFTTRPKKEVYFKFRNRNERFDRFLDVVHDHVDSENAILLDDVMGYIGVTETVLRKYVTRLTPAIKISVGQDNAGQKWVVFDTVKEVKR